MYENAPIYTTKFHGYPLEVHEARDGWFRARAVGGQLNNLSAFAKSAAGARRALESAMTNCALFGTGGNPELLRLEERPFRRHKKHGTQLAGQYAAGKLPRTRKGRRR